MKTWRSERRHQTKVGGQLHAPVSFTPEAGWAPADSQSQNDPLHCNAASHAAGNPSFIRVIVLLGESEGRRAAGVQNKASWPQQG
jgi:hypothetical protein